MALKGRLAPAGFGFSLPVASPLYDPPPHYYRDMETIAVEFETDEDAAAELLPSNLELLSSPARAHIKVSRVTNSTLGAYSEAILSLPCRWGEREFSFCVSMFSTDVASLIAGREVWGGPKLLGSVEWFTDQGVIGATVHHPARTPVATISVRPHRPVEPGSATPLTPVFLKVIPSPEAGAAPEVCELVEIPLEVDILTGQDGRREALEGRGSASITSDGVWSPWGRLPVGRIVRGSWSRSDMVVPHGRVLHRY